MLIAQKANAQRSVLPRLARAQGAQAEQHQPDAKHAVDAEERRVAVDRRRVQSLHVVERDRRIDQETEQACADQIPERHGHEEVDRPFVRCTQACCVATRESRMFSHASNPISTSGTTSSALNTAPSASTTFGVPGEIQVMERADDAARQEDDGREQHALGGGREPRATSAA